MGWYFYLAAELGFEPRQTESESVVLPLHNSAIFSTDDSIYQKVENVKDFFKKIKYHYLLFLFCCKLFYK